MSAEHKHGDFLIMYLFFGLLAGTIWVDGCAHKQLKERVAKLEKIGAAQGDPDRSESGK